MRLKQGVWQGQKLDLKQQQRLVITPQLRQAIEILQMPTMELKNKIKEELLANPLLEVEDALEVTERDDGDGLPEWEEMYANTDYAFSRQVEGGDRERISFEEYTPASVSLNEYLLQQFILLDNTAREEEVGVFLIGCLDDRGYLTFTIEDCCQWLKAEEELVAGVLEKIQGLEPAGVGARGLQECLLLQLADLEAKGHQKTERQEVSKARLLVERYFSELSEGDLAKIVRDSPLSHGEVKDAYDLISKLNPLPAENLPEREMPYYLEPDLEVREVDGSYEIINNDDRIPALFINSRYRKLLESTKEGEQTHEFIKKKLNSALWLIRSIQQRQVTIYRIMEAIVDLQIDFFRQGKMFLRPLTLQDVAEKIGVHESTVSRASSGKYVQTPHGIFEMKDFFQSGVKGKGDHGDLASYSIKQIISRLIAEEDSKRPLSDKELADIIKDKGCQISRRTVAKYRNQMGIPSSTKRKKFC
ncbi:MAG: RNA polymerase factor sigma-54 [Halanaerobium sp.]|nr:RNA polymerase factor sigma-54 [Halanaerobium sp.]